MLYLWRKAAEFGCLSGEQMRLWLCLLFDLTRRILKAGQRVIVWLVVLGVVVVEVAIGMDLPTAFAVVVGAGYIAREAAQWIVGATGSAADGHSAHPA
ncbi:hypothetical protein ACSHWB_21705 [Lentzea sp. HUAS TT2]|uniref:hypothetical protein n=1 Tax=Lentzea sp. HUAS TT2 TaxID=3447454 RepID=UPI003F7037BD